MDRCTQHRGFGEKVRFQGVGIFVWPKRQCIIDVSQGFDDFDEFLVVSIEFEHGSDFLICRERGGHHLKHKIEFIFPHGWGPIMVQRGLWG